MKGDSTQIETRLKWPNHFFKATYLSVLWMICHPGESLLHLSLLCFVFPLRHPSFLLLPPSLHLSRGPRMLWVSSPTGFELRSEEAFWLSLLLTHTHTHSAAHSGARDRLLFWLRASPCISPVLVSDSWDNSAVLPDVLPLKVESK